MKHYLKKSKRILLYKFIFILFSFYNIFSIYNFIHNYRFNYYKVKNSGVVTSITYKNKRTRLIINSNYKVFAYIDGNTDLSVGDKILYEYDNYEINEHRIPNSFSYKSYLKSLGINSVIKIKNYKLLNRGKSIYKIKNTISNLVNKRRSYAYLKTFLFSDKSDIEKDVKSSYQINGITHMLALSGFHVILFISFINYVFRKTGVNFHLSNILLVLIVLFYLFLTGFTVSLLRATLFYFISYYNNLYNLKIKKSTIFLITLNICLLNKPYYIYNTAFWYTFILSLFLMMKRVNKESRIFNFLQISIYAFLVSIPLTIYFNYSINFFTIMYNLFFIIFVCYFIYPIVFIALIFKPVDVFLYRMIGLFESTSLYLSKIKLCQIIFPKMSLFLLIVVYLILFISLYKRCYKVLLVYFIILIIIRLSVYIDKNQYVYSLDVGQGDSSLYVSSYHKSVVLIDTGGIKNDIYLRENIILFLKSIGVRSIDYLIITHGDYDHMGEAINLVNDFKVEKVIFNCGPYNDLEKELIKVLDKKKIKYYSCIKELNIDKNKLYFLQTKEYDNENDNSNVIYTELDNYKFMFMGDAGVTAEKEIISKYNISNIDVLKVGHHGSKTSSSKKFIDEINPKYSIISVDKNNRYGHPNKEVLDNLNNSKIYRTDQDGSIMFKIKNKKLKIETCSP